MSIDYSGLFNHARSVTFVSEWDDGSEVETSALYNEETGEVFDIQQTDGLENHGGCIRQYIRYSSDDFQEAIEIEVCPVCNCYVMKEFRGSLVCCDLSCKCGE